MELLMQPAGTTVSVPTGAPMAAMADAGGPTKTAPPASQAAAKPAFSLRKP